MSIHSEYIKYQHCGGTLTEERYGQYLTQVRSAFWTLILDDPGNRCSNIGRTICKHLNLTSALAFARVSKGLYERSQKHFVTMSKEIVLRYIQQGTFFKNYIEQGGWEELVIVGMKTATVAFTVAAGIQAHEHATHIPTDAPIKTEHGRDEAGHPYEISYVDHPEAYARNTWTLVCVGSSFASVAALLKQGSEIMKTCSLQTFFSTTEKEILGEETNVACTLILPKFQAWKIARMRHNLLSDPPHWQQHTQLQKMTCALTGKFMLFPVKDHCKHPHYFDYRSLRAYQLNSTTTKPSECPLNPESPIKD